VKTSDDGCGCFPTGRHYPGIAHLVRVQVSGVIAELDAEAAWFDLPIALIDVETTGRDPMNDRVVELAIVVGRRGEIVERFEWLVNPGRPIPDEARQVHKISDEMVADKPPFAELANEIVRALGGAIPGAYNATFDKAFVTAELGRAGLEGELLPASLRPTVEWIDPLVWTRELQKYEKGKSLGDVTARLGIALEGAHRATNDAEAALRVMYAFAKDVRVPKSYAALVQEQRRLARQQDEERARWRNRQ
jgi:DNA polymerase-3 subunit epsilon